MRNPRAATVTLLIACLLNSGAWAQPEKDVAAEDLARSFLATISPPGAQISFAGVEAANGGVVARDVVALSESSDGEETIMRAGVIHLQGLRPLASGLFRLDHMRVENMRVDAAPRAGAAMGNVQIAAIAASGIEGARIDSLSVSGIIIRAASDGKKYDIHIESTSLHDIDAAPLAAIAQRAQAGQSTALREDALLSALLNSHTYSGLRLRGLSVREGAKVVLSIAELGNDPDGGYVPFPASGKFFARNARIDLNNPMAAQLHSFLGQDQLQFDLELLHKFTAPGKHQWDVKLSLAPDGVLDGACAADNLSGFSPVLIRQMQAVSSSPAVLRRCAMSFSGNDFVNRLLAQDGAKEGLTGEQARGKYLALALYIPFDPQAAGDPVAQEFAKAAQIFLSQPSRLNIQIEPQGGLKFQESLGVFAMLFQGAPEQKQTAAKRLGLSIAASPLTAQ